MLIDLTDVNVRIFYYERIYVSEGIDVNKSNKSKNVWFVIIGTFYTAAINMSLKYVIFVDSYDSLLIFPLISYHISMMVY